LSRNQNILKFVGEIFCDPDIHRKNTSLLIARLLDHHNISAVACLLRHCDEFDCELLSTWSAQTLSTLKQIDFNSFLGFLVNFTGLELGHAISPEGVAAFAVTHYSNSKNASIRRLCLKILFNLLKKTDEEWSVSIIGKLIDLFYVEQDLFNLTICVRILKSFKHQNEDLFFILLEDRCGKLRGISLKVYNKEIFDFLNTLPNST
jgi:hypothetical protein